MTSSILIQAVGHEFRVEEANGEGIDPRFRSRRADLTS